MRIRDNGTMIISLDTEFIWGMHDSARLPSYYDNLVEGRNAIPRMLELFEKYDVHVSWAFVGAAMCADKKEYLDSCPDMNSWPTYSDEIRSSYRLSEKMGVSEKQDYLFFAKDVLKNILKHRNQFVGSHTFSHYYCTENGQTAEQFEADIICAKNVAQNNGIAVRSIVFPKNQVNDDYLAICCKHGIWIYRGIEENWIYSIPIRKLKSALRFVDSFIPLSGYNTYTPRSQNGVLNLRGSRILRPYSEALKFLQPLKLRRIKAEMRHAARKGEIFHLWWHPHNFGKNTEKNLEFLEEILRYFSTLNEKYGFRSLSMEEVGEECKAYD